MKRKTQKHKLFNKKAGASVGVAIKVLTAVILGAAMLAGTYGVVKTTVVPTTENKVSSMFEVTDAVELNGGGAGGGVVVPDPVVELKRNGIIPTGATYTPNGGTAIIGNGTNTFPDTPQMGDTYEEGDYIYKYNQCFENGSWPENSLQNGWGVIVNDVSKTSYDAIISEIAEKPVNTMSGTFYKCTSLTTAPVIPNSVTNMQATFYKCTSLTTAPAIPSTVTDMRSTFNGCENLKAYAGGPDANGDFSNYTFPDGVTDIQFAFYGCTLLTTAPEIPSRVTNMQATFYNCTSLTTAPVIPNSVTNMGGTFRGCTSLTTAPSIPSGVTDMSRTFYGCTSLTTAPVIPNSVTNMQSTFYNCTSLATAPAIPNGVTNMKWTFYGCTSLTTAPSIPSGVTDVYATFSGCTSLAGTIEVNANPTSYNYCLESTQITGITGSCTQATKDALMATK